MSTSSAWFHSQTGETLRAHHEKRAMMPAIVRFPSPKPDHLAFWVASAISAGESGVYDAISAMTEVVFHHLNKPIQDTDPSLTLANQDRITTFKETINVIEL